MGQLHQLGIIETQNNDTASIFEHLFPNFFEIDYSSPADYIRNTWNTYSKSGHTNNARNGKFFEYLLATLFIREGLYPLYMSAQVAFVPNAIYDILLYSRESGPICLSAKTSLRERYKQAALEGDALKSVYRKAKCFLLTLSLAEAANLKRKIAESEVFGIDKIIVANRVEFDELVLDLRQEQLIEAPSVNVIMSAQRVTKEKTSAARERR